MVSLPIPDRNSKIAYDDISWGSRHLGDIIEALTNGKVKKTYFAHLDPDLRESSINRLPGWRGIFGQAGSAQGHLINQGVAPGDIFIFFGLFRDIKIDADRSFHYSDNKPKHVIFGWLQIDKIQNVDLLDKVELPWALYHPHMRSEQDPLNTLYIASSQLNLPLCKSDLPGFGTFEKFSPRLALSMPDGPTSIWRLPKWIHPANRESCLSYHNEPNRWELHDDCTVLQTVRRGQEFVLDCGHYPEAQSWLLELLEFSRKIS
jgi:hypothetical protein